LLDIKKFEKNIAYISMSNIDLMEGAHQIGRKLNFVGAFDYQYTQKNNDSSVLTVGYINFERRKGEKNGYVFGAITYTDGKYSTDKIDLLSDATSVHVLPAKPGYVMIA